MCTDQLIIDDVHQLSAIHYASVYLLSTKPEILFSNFLLEQTDLLEIFA